MGKIYCVMGKSSSGKDSIYSRIMQQGNPALLRIVPYTTRPRREGETDGREYVFTDETHVQQLESAGMCWWKDWNALSFYAWKLRNRL